MTPELEVTRWTTYDGLMEENLNGGWVNYDDYCAVVAERDAEVARLRNALEEYGQHWNMCPAHFRRACACGFQAALAGKEGA